VTCRSERPSELGSLTVFVAVLGVALFALVGLVVDGGRAIAAQSAAYSQAEQAARAGAGQLSAEALRSGHIALDPQAAIEAADAYLAAVGERGSASVAGQIVTVHIQEVEPTVILQIIGINEINVSAEASATDLHGVTRPD
jgi:Flp pilus assembly protein TadG